MQLDAALQRYFGFAAFRAGQREACEAALEGRDVLVVMPTGSGKSLCYQLPALLRDDLTVVVSPLVALMQDQVEALRARGLGDRVALLSGQQDGRQNADALRAAVAGEASLLYVSPERFSAPGFLERMSAARVGLFVVDEAHCVSQWGHDFRPDYFRLASYAGALGARATVASTATATPHVASDIAARLSLRDPLRVATGFDRPNIAFAVARPTAGQKLPLIRDALAAEGALPAIVYTGTRKSAEDLADGLTAALGTRALAYHAGLDRERRAEVQRAFLADEAAVIVATNAFGMGVDKANVATVIHASVPASLEAYYQEAGRAGRDGRPARALLLAENRDKALHVHFIKRDELDERLAGKLFNALAQAAEDGRLPGMSSADYALDAAELARSIGCDAEALRALTGHLARAELIAPAPSSPERAVGSVLRGYDNRAAGAIRTSMAQASRARWSQYRDIWEYVEGGERCRRDAILRHFGDAGTPPGREGCCDVCDPRLALEPAVPEPIRAEGLDEAILAVAREADPSVGRTTCAEILHGARTKKIERNGYDTLAVYGASQRMRRADILARIDELIEQKRITTTGGPYPVLVAPRSAAAA